MIKENIVLDCFACEKGKISWWVLLLHGSNCKSIEMLLFCLFFFGYVMFFVLLLEFVSSVLSSSCGKWFFSSFVVFFLKVLSVNLVHCLSVCIISWSTIGELLAHCTVVF